MDSLIESTSNAQEETSPKANSLQSTVAQHHCQPTLASVAGMGSEMASPLSPTRLSQPSASALNRQQQSIKMKSSGPLVAGEAQAMLSNMSTSLTKTPERAGPPLKRSSKHHDALRKASKKRKVDGLKPLADPRQRQGTTVPCKARRMPADHNFETAVFVLHKGMKHGEHLLCSYPQCRAEGVKFCYCSLCGIPVAKRNFKSRHDHSKHEYQPIPAPPSSHKSKRRRNSKRRSPKPFLPTQGSVAKLPSRPSTGARPQVPIIASRQQVADFAATTPTRSTHLVEDQSREEHPLVSPRAKGPLDEAVGQWLRGGSRFLFWNRLLELRSSIPDDEALGKWMDAVVLVSNRHAADRDVSKSFYELATILEKKSKTKGFKPPRREAQDFSVSEFLSELSSSSNID